jgi:hypothetical protein
MIHFRPGTARPSRGLAEGGACGSGTEWRHEKGPELTYQFRKVECRVTKAGATQKGLPLRALVTVRGKLL